MDMAAENPVSLVERVADHVKAKFLSESSGHDWYHIQRVWRLAQQIAVAEGANREVAEFIDLQADLLDSSRENGQLVASVRFSGRVSESLNAPAVPFAEIWHFVRPGENDPRWVLAGIEQI